MSDSETAPELCTTENCVLFSMIVNDCMQTRCVLNRMNGNDAYPGEWWLFDMQTKPAFRNRGFATTVIKEAQRYVAKHTPGRSILLHPRAYNDMPLPDERLVQWYEKLGFAKHPDGACWQWRSSAATPRETLATRTLLHGR